MSSAQEAMASPTPSPSLRPTATPSPASSVKGPGTPPSNDNDWHTNQPFFPFLDEVRATGESRQAATSDSSDEDNASTGSASLGRSRGRRSLNRLKEIVNASVETLGLAEITGSNGRDPATGLLLALERDNAEFHRIFPTISSEEKLVDDYACAWNREGLLIQGRMWISQHRVCFKGWTPNSNLCMPFEEIISLEKKTIALVFSNSLEIETSSAKYFFASFFNRDQTFHTLRKLWDARIQPCSCAGLGTCGSCFIKARNLSMRSSGEVLPRAKLLSVGDNSPSTDSNSPTTSSSSSLPRPGDSPTVKITGANGEDGEETVFPTPPATPVLQRKANSTPARCDCEEDRKRMRTVLDTTYPAPIEQVWDMWFTAGKQRDGGWYPYFLINNRKIREYAGGPWVTKDENSTSQTLPLSSTTAPGFSPSLSEMKEGYHRTLNYVMPLSGPIGPKQTRCKVSEEILSVTSDSVCLNIKADTPDVPSGNAFHVITRICLLHAPPSHTRAIVTTEIVFTKSSWIRAAIERATPEAQAKFYKELDETLKTKLSTISVTPSATSAAPAPQPNHRPLPVQRHKSLRIEDEFHDRASTNTPVARRAHGDLDLGSTFTSPILILLFILILAALCSLSMQAIALYKVLGILERVEARIGNQIFASM
ncbi:hypothetical protein PhCBS80983_g05124 [Powellomyces hirtus]|uniref:VASt domain-containing protein n=1 Tax=Powellomyces hirtus TaxID=109895 RepID=A0A507DWY2_9FUNG|nr:hypothetical protein PhCBS80983_g05124 [Powellomyces hirtus]